MSAARRVRWECPNGKHPAVLASTRPLKDATARYCLPCSEATGRLVPRVAPALETKRAAAALRAQTKAQRARDRARAAARAQRYVTVLEADGTLGELDVAKTLAKMQRLPAVVDAAGRARWRVNEPVDFTLHRRTDKHRSGNAVSGGEIHLTLGPDPPRECVEELILHELLHYVLPGGAGHGREFRGALIRAAKRWWPGVQPVWEGHVYRMDADIWRQARELRGGAPYTGYSDWGTATDDHTTTIEVRDESESDA